MVQMGDEVDMPDANRASRLQAKGLIEPFYENKVEKVQVALKNKAYILKDEGNMYFVKHEGETIARHTKSKAIKVRDEFNDNLS